MMPAQEGDAYERSDAELLGAVAAGDLAALQGLKEDQWFDAKRPPGYDLTTPESRFELAKDVSSFANAEGSIGTATALSKAWAS